MGFVGQIGARTLSDWAFARAVAATAAGVVSLAVRPAFWPRTVRDVLARQVLFTGVEALGLTALLGLLSGVGVVTQTHVWLSRFGQSGMLGALLATVVIRELGPLLVTFLVIGRSGTAIAAELASMRVRGEIRVLDSLGLDPMAYLVLPRVVGVVLSILALTVAFAAVSLFSGFVFAMLLQVGGDAWQLAASVLAALKPADVLNLLAKTLISGTVTGVICCLEGLSIEGAATEMPQAVTRAVVKSLAATLTVSVVVSVLTYV